MRNVNLFRKRKNRYEKDLIGWWWKPISIMKFNLTRRYDSRCSWRKRNYLKVDGVTPWLFLLDLMLRKDSGLKCSIKYRKNYVMPAARERQELWVEQCYDQAGADIIAGKPFSKPGRSWLGKQIYDGAEDQPAELKKIQICEANVCDSSSYMVSKRVALYQLLCDDCWCSPTSAVAKRQRILYQANSRDMITLVMSDVDVTVRMLHEKTSLARISVTG